MKARAQSHAEDRIFLSRTRRARATRSPSQRRSYLWTLAGGVLGSTILFWVMVQLGQASSEPKGKATRSSSTSTGQTALQPATATGMPGTEPADEEKTLAPPTPALQGPGLDTPREIIEMLDLRKRDLDRREGAIRQNEERLLMVKAEIEQLLSKNEAIAKRLQAAQAKQTDEKNQQSTPLNDRERQAQEQKHQHQAQLAKMYESMPAEEAAERLERMPDRKAIEILRLVKGKTAGAILAQVKVDRAAKLTEQLLAQAP